MARQVCWQPFKAKFHQFPKINIILLAYSKNKVYFYNLNNKNTILQKITN